MTNTVNRELALAHMKRDVKSDEGEPTPKRYRHEIYQAAIVEALGELGESRTKEVLAKVRKILSKGELKDDLPFDHGLSIHLYRGKHLWKTRKVREMRQFINLWSLK